MITLTIMVNKELWISVVIFLSFFNRVLNVCPSRITITPCTCKEQIQGDTEVTCKGDLDLPQLTIVLREKLCGLHLKRFELISSHISYLPSNLFYKLIVDDIRVSFTNISHFTQAGRSAFYGLEKSLKFLSMRHCHLVDGLQWQMIGELNALISLDLPNNDLTTVPRQWFYHPPRNIKFLYLQGNKISTIYPRALETMHNLVFLDLSENFITRLERNMLPYPGNSIAFLKLSYNQLTSLPADFFDEMFGLRRLYLDNNLLQTLDEKVWGQIWGELTTLDVMGNPFNCNCEMSWIARLYPVEHFYGKCDNSSILSNRELKLLWPWDFNCNINTHTEESRLDYYSK